MHKRQHEDNPIQGYIADVSPIKLGANQKTRYFTANLQTSKTEVRRVICFNPEKHQSIQAAADSNDAFVLQHATLQPGRDQKLEVKLSKDTQVVKASHRLQFSKDYQSMVSTQGDQTPNITSLDDLKKEYQLATVNIKYLGLIEKERIVRTRYGPKSIAVAIIADNTKSLKLVIWNAKVVNQLKQGESYELTDLQTRNFDGTLQLNTTSSTMVKTITPLHDTNEQNLKDFFEELQLNDVQFQSVNIVSTYSCTVCFKVIEIETEEQIIRCESCKYKQQIKKLKECRQIYAHMEVNEELKKVQITDEAIKTMLIEEDKATMTQNTDALEDYIMLNQFNVTLAVNNLTVIKIEKCVAI